MGRITLHTVGLLVDRLSKMCYNRGIVRNKKGNDMTTVKDLIAILQAMPQDASVILQGSYETFDGYSHPFVELDTDGEVIIREACEDEVTQ
jgi:hypothetical protein